MRDSILFYVNGKRHSVGPELSYQSLSDYLRYESSLTGTKVVCAEGDCGACTVLVARVNADTKSLEYKPVNSCIQYLYQLDLCHVITVEGLKQDGNLNPLQEAMVSCHGAQCGYCTPGFVVTMSHFFNQCADKSPGAESSCQSASSICADEISRSLTGNLCRCTGYDSIIKAGLETKIDQLLPFSKLYAEKEIIAELAQYCGQSVLLETAEHNIMVAHKLSDALEYKKANSAVTIVSGGTDICVACNKRDFTPKAILALNCLQELDFIDLENGNLNVGATVSLYRLEEYIRDYVPEFYNLLYLFGSPQIRHAGTLAGNIANGSPIGDSLPFLFVCGAKLELFSARGSRLVEINDFYSGYKKMDISADEIIRQIVIPLPQKSELLKLYKVSRRKNLDISSFTAAFLVSAEDASWAKLKTVKIAFGGVAPVVLRLKKAEEFLLGKEIALETFKAAADIALTEIAPISDVRGSSNFRNLLAANIFSKCFYEIQDFRLMKGQRNVAAR